MGLTHSSNRTIQYSEWTERLYLQDANQHPIHFNTGTLNKGKPFEQNAVGGKSLSEPFPSGFEILTLRSWTDSPCDCE